MSREYLELSTAFGDCLQLQIALGARLVTAIANNLADLDAGDNCVTWCEVKEIRKRMREGRRTLVHIRKSISKLSR